MTHGHMTYRVTSAFYDDEYTGTLEAARSKAKQRSRVLFLRGIPLSVWIEKLKIQDKPKSGTIPVERWSRQGIKLVKTKGK